jgi:hypothetical protein
VSKLLVKDPARGKAQNNLVEMDSDETVNKRVEPTPRPDSTGVGRSHAILVLGVHRSGTSALTQVLGLCGASMPETLMQPTAINPRGFFESQRIFELHEELLGELGSSWHDLAPLPNGWMSSSMAANYVDKMVDLVASEYGDASLFIVKDPRICRLIPFWLAVLEKMEILPHFVLPIRNPMEVAGSLEKAEGLDPQHGLLLWLNGVLQAEYDSRGYPRCFVDYEALLANWRGVVEKVSSDLSITFPRLGRRSSVEIDSFLDVHLRNHSVSAEEFRARGDLLSWAKTTFDWMSMAIAGNPQPASEIDQLRLAFAEAEKAFGPVLAHMQVAREDSNATTQEMSKAISELTDERDQLEASLVPLNDESGRVQVRLEAKENQVAELIDCIKLMLIWIASRAPGSNSSSEELELLLTAMDTSDSSSIAQTAMEGLKRYQDSNDFRAETQGVHPQRRGIGRAPLGPANPESREKARDEGQHRIKLLDAQRENEVLKDENKACEDRIKLLATQVAEKQQLVEEGFDELALAEKSDADLRKNLSASEDRLERTSNELKEQFQTQLARSQELEQNLQGSNENLLEANRGLQTQLTRRQELEEKLQRIDANLLETNRELEARDRENKTLEERVSHLGSDQQRLREELQERDRAIHSFERSVSWRITLPFRYLGLGLRKAGLTRLFRPLARLMGLGK